MDKKIVMPAQRQLAHFNYQLVSLIKRRVKFTAVCQEILCELHFITESAQKCSPRFTYYHPAEPKMVQVIYY